MNADSQHKQSDHFSIESDTLSALLDGEASTYEVDALLVNTGADLAAVHGRWQSYLLVSESLRGERVHSPLTPQADFLAGVLKALPESGAVPLQLQSSQALRQVRAPAANDALLRWKLVAGAASLSAVMAVSWSVLRDTTVNPNTDETSLVRLASQPAPQESAGLAQPVEVKTQQGTLIRDARLEQLLAEHRQYGGASALQTPAGFLRNATFEAAPTR